MKLAGHGGIDELDFDIVGNLHSDYLVFYSGLAQGYLSPGSKHQQVARGARFGFIGGGEVGKTDKQFDLLDNAMQQKVARGKAADFRRGG